MTQTEQDAFRAYVKADRMSPKQHVRDYYNWLEAQQVMEWAGK